MASDLTFDIQLSFREEDADGSACAMCGDTLYLSPAHRIVVTVKIGKGESKSSDGSLICASCREMIDIKTP